MHSGPDVTIDSGNGFTHEIWYDSMKKRYPSWDLQEQRITESARPSFREIYMDMARSLARRSTCRRLQVGCVITSMDFRKVFAVGYNGNASGQPDKCDSAEPGRCGCLHAEENAAINCDAPRYVEKAVFCTHLPCLMCAKRLINMGGVQVVHYSEDYRLHDAVDLLLVSAIQVVQLKA